MRLARDTAQRRAVLDVLRAASDHPTAAEIRSRVLAAAPGIGAATVYRSLHMLVASNLASEVRLGGETVIRYDGNTTAHDHLVCELCGGVVDISPRVPVVIPPHLAAMTGYRITGHEVRFSGQCPDCVASDHANSTSAKEI